MPRPAEGQLILRKSGYVGRYTALVEGESLRVAKALGTHNRAVARARLDRLITEARRDGGTTVAELEAATATGETFEVAARRVHKLRRAEIASYNADGALRVFERLVFPAIGRMPVRAVQPTDLNAIFDSMKAEGLSRETLRLYRTHISAVYRQLAREDESITDPTRRATLPKYAVEVVRERAVLIDDELICYIAYEHPRPTMWRTFVLERQVMAVMARTLGGMRTSDLHHLKWETLDSELGAFTWCLVPRRKTRRPQRLAVPVALRPIIRRWWELCGKPTRGLIFPTKLRSKRSRADGARSWTHAGAFRRDLERAFHARPDMPGVPRPGSARWIELFEETDVSLPVDFHSFRRSFAQALADSGVPAQQAMCLTAHSNAATHAKYLHNSDRMRQIPDAAVPPLDRLAAHEKAPAKGTVTAKPVENLEPDVQSLLRFLAATRTYRAPSSRLVEELHTAKRKQDNALQVSPAAVKAPVVPERGGSPVVPRVGVLDLLAAIDAAVADGTVQRVVAAARAAIEAGRITVVPEELLDAAE